ncbi:MAG: hypothetical protein NC541_15490, partial [bacterium]|nr:hypothetical protein [bacterium]
TCSLPEMTKFFVILEVAIKNTSFVSLAHLQKSILSYLHFIILFRLMQQNFYEFFITLKIKRPSSLSFSSPQRKEEENLFSLFLFSLHPHHLKHFHHPHIIPKEKGEGEAKTHCFQGFERVLREKRGRGWIFKRKVGREKKEEDLEGMLFKILVLVRFY